MSENIAVIYERGILRPLKPLRLPEYAQLEIRIITTDLAAHTAKEMARQALLQAGIIRANS